MYHEIDWGHSLPDSETIQSMWKTISFSAIQIQRTLGQHPLLNAFREINSLKENVVFLQFQGPNHPTFCWFASRNRLPEIGFFKNFLQSVAIVTQEQYLEFDATLEPRLEFETISGFSLDGMLAADLFWGGTVHGYKGSAIKAKELSESFCTKLFGNRHDEIVVYRTQNAWSQWFHEYGADCTYIILDRRTGVFSILCVTDSA